MPSENRDLFAKGTPVEVCSDEEGFRGAWFVAKVLDIVPPPSPTTSLEKMKYLVEYQSLLCHDGSELLRELIPFKLVRPLPPLPSDEHDGQQRFQVNDVVDAYYNDGWWIGVVSKVYKEEEPMKYSVSFKNPSHVFKFKSSELRFHLDWVGDKWVQTQKRNKTSKGQEKRKEKKEAEISSHKRKRGKHVKSLHKGKECDGAECGIDKLIVNNSSTVGVESATSGDTTEMVTELSDRGSKAKDIEMVDVDDHGSMSSPTIAVNSRAASVENMSYENPNLKLLKSSPVLSFVQSMKEFQEMPQKPHFHPLDDCEEVCREGLLLKHMMTFVNVVKETSKLQVNSSGSIMDSLFKCIPELESHGFDVKDVRSRLLELRSMKAALEQLQTKLEKVYCEIAERTCEGTKMKAESDDATKEITILEEKIKVAEEKKTKLILMNEENDSVIVKLRSSDDLLNEDILKVHHKFASLAASPWR